MKPTRLVPLLVSVTLVLFLLGGGLVAKVGAEENSFHQVVVFSEVLSLVLDSYVEAVDARTLLHGAFEGMLAGLDPHGAYLTPDELKEWKAFRDEGLADPGISVLLAGRALQVVSVDPGSPADEAGIRVGDQIRQVDGRPVRQLSLDQAWRLILGTAGTSVRLDLFHASGGFRREQIEVARALRKSPAYHLQVKREIGVLRIHNMSRVPIDELIDELDDVRSRGVTHLLLDLRNVADNHPGRVEALAGLFSSGPLLRLRDRAGNLMEDVSSSREQTAWSGSITALVNGATAGSAEGLASVIQTTRKALVIGEPTYGLGSRVKLYEMEDGSGLLVSAALWETVSGARWNGHGIEPDEVIHGKGTDYEKRFADQLDKALDFVERHDESEAGTQREAA